MHAANDGIGVLFDRYTLYYKKGLPHHHTASPVISWSRRADLNRWPADYESAALPAELRRQSQPFKGSGFSGSRFTAIQKL